MEFTGGQGPITCMSEYEDVLFTASSENILCTWDRLVNFSHFFLKNFSNSQKSEEN